MPSPIVSVVMILFVPSIILLFSVPNITASTSISPLIRQACSSQRNSKICMKVLQTKPKIASAINLFDLSIAIIESGISDVGNIDKYVTRMLEKTNLEPSFIDALLQCKFSYDLIIASFDKALNEIRVKDSAAYQTASEDLLGMNMVELCEKAVASNKVNDRIISNGNKIVRMFGLAAYEVADSLPPPVHHEPPPTAMLI